MLPEIDEVTVALVDFLAQLTGGDFQSPKGVPDSEHIRNIGYTAASLRTALIHLRDSELAYDMNRSIAERIGSLVNGRGYIWRH